MLYPYIGIYSKSFRSVGREPHAVNRKPNKGYWLKINEK